MPVATEQEQIDIIRKLSDEVRHPGPLDKQKRLVVSLALDGYARMREERLLAELRVKQGAG